MNSQPKPGFFDLPAQQLCRHPDHDVPSHMYVPAGQGYRHVCPVCGYSLIVVNPLRYEA